MKYCSKCGAEIKEGADVCLGCGDILNKNNNQISKIENMAITGFILSLIGFWIFAIPCGVAAIITCSAGLKKAKDSKTSKGFAIAGLIIGIIDVISGILLISGVL